MDEKAKLSKTKELITKEVGDLTTKGQVVEATKEYAIWKQAATKEANLQLMTKKAKLDKEKANIKAVLD